MDSKLGFFFSHSTYHIKEKESPPEHKTSQIWNYSSKYFCNQLFPIYQKYQNQIMKELPFPSTQIDDHVLSGKVFNSKFENNEMKKYMHHSKIIW